MAKSGCAFLLIAIILTVAIVSTDDDDEEEEEDEDIYAWRKSCWPDPYGIILPQNYETLAAYEEDLNASIESILAGETEI